MGSFSFFLTETGVSLNCTVHVVRAGEAAYGLMHDVSSDILKSVCDRLHSWRTLTVVWNAVPISPLLSTTIKSYALYRASNTSTIPGSKLLFLGPRHRPSCLTRSNAVSKKISCGKCFDGVYKIASQLRI